MFWGMGYLILQFSFVLLTICGAKNAKSIRNMKCAMCRVTFAFQSCITYIIIDYHTNFVMHHSIPQHTLPWELPLIARNENLAWQ
jgi:hypothetical protein